MELGVRDASALMNVSDKTIYRWIKQDKLPAFKVNEQYRFNRSELLEWATSNGVSVSALLGADPEAAKQPSGLADALRIGGIHYRVGGTDKSSVLHAALGAMPLPSQVDRAFLLEVLLTRESMGSTAVGDGVAIPHVRNPIVLHIPRPMISLCFLETPIEFGALDGKPVSTLFTIISPTIGGHLNLISRLAHGLRQKEFATTIRRQGNREEIVTAAEAVDARVALRPETHPHGDAE